MHAEIPRFDNPDELSRMLDEGCPNDPAASVEGPIETYPADDVPPNLNQVEPWWTRDSDEFQLGRFEDDGGPALN